MRDWLRDGFRYDLWANEKWAPLVAGPVEEIERPASPTEFPAEPSARAAEVFAHILRAQRLWLVRCETHVQSEGIGWIRALHEAWIDQIERRDPVEVIRFVHPVLGNFEQPFCDIARQVINHGTYHRGQLREVAEVLGIDIPETDFTRWRLEFPSSPSR